MSRDMACIKLERSIFLARRVIDLALLAQTLRFMHRAGNRTSSFKVMHIGYYNIITNKDLHSTIIL